MPLGEALQETLDMVPRKGFITADELTVKIEGVSATAQNNRLERLRKLEFLTRARNGKCWRYSRA